MTLGSPGTPKNMDELLLLLWVKPRQRLWAELACSSPSQYLQGRGWRNVPNPGGLRGRGERGHQPCGASSIPAPKGGGTIQASPSSAGLCTGPQPFSPGAVGHLGVPVCVCVSVCPLQSTLGSPRPGILAGDRTRQWCRTKASLAPLASLRCPERSPRLAPVNVPDRSVSVPLFVLTSSPC